jgi:hypothetical protein
MKKVHCCALLWPSVTVLMIAECRSPHRVSAGAWVKFPRGVVGDVAGAGGGRPSALGCWLMDWFHERAIFKAFQELACRLASGEAS